MNLLFLISALLAGCSDGMSQNEVEIASAMCLDKRMIPHVHYTPHTNEITRVTCEPK